MAPHGALAPADELARKNGVRFPNESKEYRQARDALLAEEIELRRHIERVAQQRRALPPGGEVNVDYRFEGENGPLRFADLFGDKQTLVDLQLHVRAAARAAVSDVHLALERLGRRSAGRRATRRARCGRAFADRAARSRSRRNAAGATSSSIPT